MSSDLIYGLFSHVTYVSEKNMSKRSANFWCFHMSLLLGEHFENDQAQEEADACDYE